MRESMSEDVTGAEAEVDANADAVVDADAYVGADVVADGAVTDAHAAVAAERASEPTCRLLLLRRCDTHTQSANGWRC